MHFDYIRLRARIREKLGSDVVFAARLGISKTSLSLRLNNQLHFSQRDIYNSMRILNTNYRWKIYLGWKIHDVKNVHYAMLAFRMWFCKAS